MRSAFTRAVVIAPGALMALAMLAVLGVLGLARSAYAGSDVGVIVTGDGTLQPQLTAQIEDWLSRHGHTLVPAALPYEVIPTLNDCFVQPDPKGCARRIIEARARSSTMVYALLETINNSENGRRDVTLTAYWFDRGHEALAERQTCESCTDQLLRTTADNVMAKLIGVAAAGHVKLRSAPAGAQISIDGKPIGQTPLDRDLPPGSHTITMEKAGFEPESRVLVVVSDRTDNVALELEPRTDDGKPSRVVPFGVMAAGGALIATGFIMIGINQEPGPREPPRIYHTTLEGTAFVAGGAIAAGVGVYMAWFRSPTASSTPIAAFTGDAGYVGWLKRF